MTDVHKAVEEERWNPDSNLEEQLKIAERLVDRDPTNWEDAQRLAELVVTMDEWIGSGGFMPKRWRRRQA